MSEPVVITWNITNWITVVLMAAVGFAIYKAVTSYVQKKAEA